MENDIARLQCFDALTAANDEDPVDVNAGNTAGWDVETDTDPISDAETISFFRFPDEVSGSCADIVVKEDPDALPFVVPA